MVGVNNGCCWWLVIIMIIMMVVARGLINGCWLFIITWWTIKYHLEIIPTDKDIQPVIMQRSFSINHWWWYRYHPLLIGQYELNEFPGRTFTTCSVVDSQAAMIRISGLGNRQGPLGPYQSCVLTKPCNGWCSKCSSCLYFTIPPKKGRDYRLCQINHTNLCIGITTFMTW